MKAKKHPGGRPTEYREQFNEQAYKMCLLGADDAGLAELFGVTGRTINRWKRNYPEFCQSLRAGKAIADAEVASALYKSATGRHVITEDRVVSDGEGGTKIVTLSKQVPPDVAAQKAWLHNRAPKYWRNQPETLAEINFNPVPQAELDRIHAINLEKQKELMATVMGRVARLGIVTSYIDSSATREAGDEKNKTE
jgi:hypothetical protein